eukprot:scaffold45827_cov42-Prasinocladus_malaysianus.AAC.1
MVVLAYGLLAGFATRAVVHALVYECIAVETENFPTLWTLNHYPTPAVTTQTASVSPRRPK